MRVAKLFPEIVQTLKEILMFLPVRDGAVPRMKQLQELHIVKLQQRLEFISFTGYEGKTLVHRVTADSKPTCDLSLGDALFFQ